MAPAVQGMTYVYEEPVPSSSQQSLSFTGNVTGRLTALMSDSSNLLKEREALRAEHVELLSQFLSTPKLEGEVPSADWDVTQIHAGLLGAAAQASFILPTVDAIDRLIPLVNEVEELRREQELLIAERRELLADAAMLFEVPKGAVDDSEDKDLVNVLPLLVEGKALSAERERLHAENQAFVIELKAAGLCSKFLQFSRSRVQDNESNDHVFQQGLISAMEDVVRENSKLQEEVSRLRDQNDLLRARSASVTYGVVSNEPRPLSRQPDPELEEFQKNRLALDIASKAVANAVAESLQDERLKEAEERRRLQLEAEERRRLLAAPEKLMEEELLEASSGASGASRASPPGLGPGTTSSRAVDNEDNVIAKRREIVTHLLRSHFAHETEAMKRLQAHPLSLASTGKSHLRVP